MSVPIPVLYVDYYEWYGGGQHSLLSILKGLNRQRFTPLLAVNQEGRLAQEARQAGIPVLIADTGRGRWRYFWKAIPAYLKMLKFSVDHGVQLVHSNGLKAAKFGAAIAGSLFVPAVWHKRIHVDKAAGSSTARLWRFYSRFQDRILGVSLAVCEDLKRIGIAGAKVRSLPNFVDPGPYKNGKALSTAARKKLGLPLQSRLVGMVGARRHHKGCDLFLKASSLLAQKKGPWSKTHFVMIGSTVSGEEAYEAALTHQQESFPAPDRLHVVGEQENIAEWMKSLSLLVCPSRREGFGRVAVEAMIAGCPVVAAYPEAGEIMENGKDGILAPDNDPIALGQAMELALSNQAALKKRVERARITALETFGPSAYFDKLETHYGELLHA